MNLKVFCLFLSIVCLVHGNTTRAHHKSKLYIFKNIQSNRYLEDIGAKIIASESSPFPLISQKKWLVSQIDPATKFATLLNASTRKYLDTNSLGDVFTSAEPGGLYQNWRMNGSALINGASGLALTLDAAGEVFTSVPDGGNGQEWTAIEALVIFEPSE